jgi:hypothetical protein
VSIVTFTLPGTIESARALAKAFGPLLCASDDPNDPPALLAAQANYNIKAPGWCKGHPFDRKDEPAEAYYRDQPTGSHGWMCSSCRKTTQTG